MEVELLSQDKKQGTITFLLKDSSPALANALRRAILDEVPTLAIEDVEFKKNSSVLYDEMIAHRMGLIPIKTDLKSYNVKSECKCKGEGCAQCTLNFSLSATGPGNVCADKLKSKDPKCVPVNEGTPIVRLLKSQQLKLEATAVLGRGKDHRKWSPGHVYYKYNPVITIKNVSNAEDVSKVCPKNVFDHKSGKLSINDKRLLDCHLCAACVDAALPEGSVKLGESNSDFVFYVESWGQLSPKEMVLAALEILSEKTDALVKEVKNL